MHTYKHAEVYRGYTVNVRHSSFHSVGVVKGLLMFVGRLLQSTEYTD